MRKILLFDMDGTLTDSMPVYASAIEGVLREDGGEIPEGLVTRTATMTVEEVLDTLLSLGCKGDRASLAARLDMRALYAEKVPLKPGVKTFLEKKKSEGCRLLVITGSPHACADPCLRRNGVLPLFDHVYTTSDFDAPKYLPGIYLAICDLQGFSPADVTFFDDNARALAAARSAGMEAIGVADAANSGEEDAVRAAADSYIESFADLI
ncbi:MAG: HAD family phosphatase [Clostridia bacterium]|nr:HAD family phosphatase [Clostridia bacterium]